MRNAVAPNPSTTYIFIHRRVQINIVSLNSRAERKQEPSLINLQKSSHCLNMTRISLKGVYGVEMKIQENSKIKLQEEDEL